MRNATHAESPSADSAPIPASPAVWSADDAVIVRRLRADADADGLDWRGDWKLIGPSKIQSVVDELFPGPKNCGASKALRIQKLIPVVPEGPEDSVPAAPRSAPVRKTSPLRSGSAPVVIPIPEPSAPEAEAEPERSAPEPSAPESSAPEVEPEVPEHSGRLARLRQKFRRAAPEPEAPEPPRAPRTPRARKTPPPPRPEPEAPAAQPEGKLRLVPPIASLGLSAVMQVIIVTDLLGHALVERYGRSVDNKLLLYGIAAVFGMAIASALEGAAAYVMDLYDKHLLARDSVFTLRLAMIAYVIGSAALIHWWTDERKLPVEIAVVLSCLSGSSLFLWTLGSKWKNRERMRANGQLDPAMPRLSTAAKAFHPVRWIRTMYLVSWEPASTADEARDRYVEWESDRSTRRAKRKRQ